MMTTSNAGVRSLAFAAALSVLPACATSFSLTSEFSTPAEPGARGGGGGCSGDSYLAWRPMPLDSNGKLVAEPSAVFARDFWCADGPIAVSINGKSYVVEPAASELNRRFFESTGFRDAYSDTRQGLRVNLRHLETIREVADKATDCVTRYSKVEVSISFAGTAQTFIGYTGGGCP